jgi:hypothetical protein
MLENTTPEDDDGDGKSNVARVAGLAEEDDDGKPGAQVPERQSIPVGPDDSDTGSKSQHPSGS